MSCRQRPSVTHGSAAGTATITAAKGGLSAEATIAVIAGTTLAEGTIRWRVPPTPLAGLGTQPPIYTHQVDETVPAMYTFEWDLNYTTARLRGLNAVGEVQSSLEIAGKPLFADAFGGLVFGLGDDGFNQGLARLAGPASARPWRYESPGYLSTPAAASDGTIYVLESRYAGSDNTDGSPIMEMQAISLDGSTGSSVGPGRWHRK